MKNAVISEIRAAQSAHSGRKHRIGFISGNFNIVHPGHVRLLQFARDLCDFLVVGVNMDDASGVTVPLEMRLESVSMLNIIDFSFALEVPAEQFIAELKPEVVIKGTEYRSRNNPEQSVVDNYNGKLVFGSGKTHVSSFTLLDQEMSKIEHGNILLSSGYPKRHGFEISELSSILDKIRGMRVLVIGDLIIDDYITCNPLGMSQEDPTIVVTPMETKTFVGGAGAVTSHANGLGADVSFISVVGADETAGFARQRLEEHGIDTLLMEDFSRPTIRKQRYRANGKTLLRVNHFQQHAISTEFIEKILKEMEERLPRTDLLLFSDFNYGCLPQNLVDRIIELGQKHNVIMCADSQVSSQLGDISRFHNMKLVTPTELEVRLAVKDPESGLAVLASKLTEKSDIDTVIITLGIEGLLIHSKNSGQFITDRLPAFNRSPVDVAGAGDSLLCTTSLALCAGIDPMQAAYLGSIAAACHVSRIGNMPLKTNDIVYEINKKRSENA